MAPTSKERINKIITNSKGFVYCVSHAGTTGEQNTVSINIKEYLQEVKIIQTLNMCRLWNFISRNSWCC